MTPPKTKNKPHVPPVEPAWLDRTPETPIETPYEVTDSHIHLWDYSEPPYFGDAYAAEAAAAGISSSVYVECSMAYLEEGPVAARVAGEVDFARDQAEAHSSPDHTLAAAIVGAADIRLGNGIRPILEQLIEVGGGKFRGIRVRAATDPDPVIGYGPMSPPADLLRQPESLDAIATLQDMGLSLDVYSFHTQLSDVVALARAFPDLPIIVNHAGTPLGAGSYADRRAAVQRDWSDGIRALAPFEQVSIKIGGFAISRVNIVSRGDRAAPPGSAELAETFAPWFETCLEAVGPERCMYGSNFPVDKVAMSLTNQCNAMKHLVAPLSPDEAAAVMGGTARRVYRIGTAATG